MSLLGIPGIGTLGTLGRVRWSASLGPHTWTARYTYSPPAGVLVVVRGLYLEVLRTAASTALGSAILEAYITDGSDIFMLNIARVYSTAVGARDRVAMSPNLPVEYGGSFVIGSYDGSTGGTVFYFFSVLLEMFEEGA